LIAASASPQRTNVRTFRLTFRAKMFYKCSAPNRSKRIVRDCGCDLTSSIVINGLFHGAASRGGWGGLHPVPVVITKGNMEIMLT
jgi:hypothetical protein